MTKVDREADGGSNIESGANTATREFSNRGIAPEVVQDTEQTNLRDDRLMILAEAAIQHQQAHSTPEVAMTDDQHIAAQPDEVKSTAAEPGTSSAVSTQADMQHESPKDHHIYVKPVTNPEDFPVHRLQTVQAQYYPSTKVPNMLVHHDSNGDVFQVTADLEDGPVNFIMINDARIISALGICEGTNDTIKLQEDEFRKDETFIVSVDSRAELKNLDNFAFGELQSARHAYLHWLDHRGAADPRRPPYIQEARMLAVKLGRRAPDVWREIDGYWELEHGKEGRKYREGRMKYLGENPIYEEGTERAAKDAVSMWK
jgi:hypothetical protein